MIELINPRKGTSSATLLSNMHKVIILHNHLNNEGYLLNILLLVFSQGVLGYVDIIKVIYKFDVTSVREVNYLKPAG